MTDDSIEGENRFRLLFEKIADPMLLLDPQLGHFIDWNPAALNMLGYPDKQHVYLLRPVDISPERQPDGRLSAEKTIEMMNIALRDGNHRYEWATCSPYRCEFLLEVLLTTIEMSGRQMFITTWRDLTQQKLAENELRESQQRLQLATSHNGVGIWDWHMQEGRLIWDDAMFDIYHIRREDFSGNEQSWRQALHADDVSRAETELNAALYEKKVLDTEFRIVWPNGEIRHIRAAGKVFYDDHGAPLRMLGTNIDITERNIAEQSIMRLAHYDVLTGLPNRALFMDRLEQQIKKTNRTGSPLVLIFIDLDHFKEINDTLGHDIGDILLKEAAQRLLGCLRETDTVARLGGDEFTVILSELEDISSVDRIAQQILLQLALPFHLLNEDSYISASLGITLYPDDAATSEQLLRNADQAMYNAKNTGRNRYSYFTPSMQERAALRMRLLNDMRAALLNHQFYLVYQPIIELATGSIHKAEALIRWQHPIKGLVTPADFISIAEQSGLIVEIGQWVFEEVVNQVKHLRATHHKDFQISVNKSPLQFDNEKKNHAVWFDYLSLQGLPGESIAVEITEGLLMDASEQTKQSLLAFRDAGIQVALDDFGTGYSSMSYLKRFDIDYLKIDQSFIKNMALGSGDIVICEAIIVMAHRLHIKVIAEGIETATQRDILTKAGCDYAQGYFFSKPLTAKDFESFLKTA